MRALLRGDETHASDAVVELPADEAVPFFGEQRQPAPAIAITLAGMLYAAAAACVLLLDLGCIWALCFSRASTAAVQHHKQRETQANRAGPDLTYDAEMVELIAVGM